MGYPFGGKDTSRTAYPSFSVTDDLDMLETALEDADLANRYCLHLVTGEVAFFSEHPVRGG